MSDEQFVAPGFSLALEFLHAEPRSGSYHSPGHPAWVRNVPVFVELEP